jgi:hypothetical protein
LALKESRLFWATSLVKNKKTKLLDGHCGDNILLKNIFILLKNIFMKEITVMNFDLKIALLQKFGSQIVGARRLEMAESRLSYLVRGHKEPSAKEREKLRQALGKDYFSVSAEGPRTAA